MTLHLHLAERVLERWRAEDASPPFSLADPLCLAAFRLGSMGPDLGYLPGGFRPLSDLAHTLWTGELAGNLVACAATPLDRAFAWGWVTHHLGDVLIHPLIGRAVGEALRGDRAQPVSADEEPVEHVRIEAGLDALYACRHPHLRAHSLLTVRDTGLARSISRAYRRTYGVTPGVSIILACLRRAPRRLRQGMAVAALNALALPAPGLDVATHQGPVTRIRTLVSRQSVSLGFLLPASPRPWLVRAVASVETTFEDAFLTVFRDGGRLLPNLNLDTGRPDLTERSHSGLHRALAFLAEKGGRPPDRAASGLDAA